MSRPRWIYGVHGLTSGEKLCLALLWTYAPYGAATAFVWPSVARLTELLGQHERTTRRQLEALTRAGLLDRSRRETDGGDTEGWTLCTPGTYAISADMHASGTDAHHSDTHVREPDNPETRTPLEPGTGATQSGRPRPSYGSGNGPIMGEGVVASSPVVVRLSGDPEQQLANRLAVAAGLAHVDHRVTRGLFSAAVERLEHGTPEDELLAVLGHHARDGSASRPDRVRMLWGKHWEQTRERYLRRDTATRDDAGTPDPVAEALRVAGAARWTPDQETKA